jgi:hypothetical protein
MRKTQLPILMAVLAVAVSACGSGNSTTAAAPPTTSSAAAAAPTTSSGTTGTASAYAQKLTTQAQQLIGQLSTATGELASTNSSQQHHAHQLLAQVHARATKLQSQATTQLAPGNPARPLVLQAAKGAAAASSELQGVHVSGVARQGLLVLKGALASLSAALGHAQGQTQSANVSKLTEQLKSLARQLSASTNAAANGSATTSG